MEIGVAPAECDQGVTVVRPSGEVGTEGAQELDIAVQRELAEGRCRLVLDFAEVTYLNSAGVGTVAIAVKRSRGRGGDVALANLQGRVRRAIELVRLDRVMIVAGSVEEACVRLRSAPPSPREG